MKIENIETKKGARKGKKSPHLLLQYIHFSNLLLVQKKVRSKEKK